MFLIEVFKEKPRKHVAFCFGRMNPPTLGHARLMNTVARAAQSSDYFIFVSPTEGEKKNPLSYFEKIEIIKLSSNRMGRIEDVNNKIYEL